MAMEPNAPTALVPTDLGKTRPSMALRWLHCPRCGQSFAVTFLRYGCPACADNITKFIESRSGMGDKKVYEAEEKCEELELNMARLTRILEMDEDEE